MKPTGNTEDDARKMMEAEDAKMYETVSDETDAKRDALRAQRIWDNVEPAFGPGMEDLSREREAQMKSISPDMIEITSDGRVGLVLVDRAGTIAEGIVRDKDGKVLKEEVVGIPGAVYQGHGKSFRSLPGHENSITNKLISGSEEASFQEIPKEKAIAMVQERIRALQFKVEKAQEKLAGLEKGKELAKAYSESLKDLPYDVRVLLAPRGDTEAFFWGTTNGMEKDKEELDAFTKKMEEIKAIP